MFQALCVTTDGPRSDETNASNPRCQQTLTLMDSCYQHPTSAHSSTHLLFLHWGKFPRLHKASGTVVLTLTTPKSPSTGQGRWSLGTLTDLCRLLLPPAEQDMVSPITSLSTNALVDTGTVLINVHIVEPSPGPAQWICT